MTVITNAEYTMRVMNKKDETYMLYFEPKYVCPGSYYSKKVHTGWTCIVISNDYPTLQYEYNETNIAEIVTEWIMNEYKYTQPINKIKKDYDDDEE